MVKNTMELVEKTSGCINARYDMHICNLLDIHKASSDTYDMICNGFRFGYIQGMKAAKAEERKRS